MLVQFYSQEINIKRIFKSSLMLGMHISSSITLPLYLYFNKISNISFEVEYQVSSFLMAWWVFLRCFRDCLQGAVVHNEEAELRCPYQDNDYACNASLQDREIKAVCNWW